MSKNEVLQPKGPTWTARRKANQWRKLATDAQKQVDDARISLKEAEERQANLEAEAEHWEDIARKQGI